MYRNGCAAKSDEIERQQNLVLTIKFLAKWWAGWFIAAFVIVALCAE